MERGLDREKTTKDIRGDEEERGMSAKLLLQLYHCATWRVPVLCCQVLNRKTKDRDESKLNTGHGQTKIYTSLLST